MRAVFFGILMMSTLPSFASAENCQKSASISAMKTFTEYFVGKDGSQLRTIDSSECLADVENNQVNCEVLTNDGTGALDVFYNVILDRDCKSTIDVSISYIE